MTTPDDADTNRRTLLQTLALGGAAALTTGLTACGGGASSGDAAVAVDALGNAAAAPGRVAFEHGVASGDPLTDRVVLWSRVTPNAVLLGELAALEAAAKTDPLKLLELEERKQVTVRWEVARDEAFRQRVRQGVLQTSADRDWTLKVDVDGLAPGTTYFYRFTGRGIASPVGRTKTAPALLAGAAAQVRLGVFSCSNYPAGYFNVYGAAATDELDAAVHLGDYLYEYARGGYASGNAAALGRLSLPETEIVTLADYRARHAQYRTDPDLQALTARTPLIAVWDDHEITNNAWRAGAENHQPATEGDYLARVEAARRAYYEWLPVREPADAARLYRSFDFGGIVALHMLDTRIVGRDQQLDYANYFLPGGGLDAARFVADVGNPNRQLLGAAQFEWLQGQLLRSTATWQILGQQVLMGRMNVPAPLLTGTTVAQYGAIVAKAQAGLALTPQEQAILAAPSIPYNLDAWDGYAAQREAVLATARTLDRNLVVFAGDTHNAWANDLLDVQGRQVGVEFATASVSSPGFEGVFPNENPAVFAQALQQLIGPLVYADTSRRGYLRITATAAECRADWRFVDTIANRNYAVSTARSLRALPGAGNRKVVEA